jgi:tetratricopeptide (TPR) repeat protein
MKIFLITVTFFLFGIIFSTFGQVNSRFEQAKLLLIETRDKIYNFDSNDSLIQSNIFKSKSVFETLPITRDQMFWSAQAEYFEGLYYLKKHSKKEAELHFFTCNSILNKSIKEFGDFSEAYSLLADSHMQLMLSKGITYQILNGQKLKLLPEKAIQLDSANIKAYQSLAVYCMNAPEALGGGIQKAINLLMKLSSKDKCEMFKIYYLLGNAYMKIHNSVLASQYLQMALSLYPQNQWAEEDLQIINSRMKKR